MQFFSKHLAQRENLLPHSAAVSLFFLLTIYVIAQFLTYRLLAEERRDEERMEIQEVMKLEMPRPPVPKPKFVPKPDRAKAAPVSKPTLKPSTQPEAPHVNVADLMAGIETKTLLATRNGGSRSSPGRFNNVSQVRVEANAAPHQFDPSSNFTAAAAAGSFRGRVAAPGNNHASGVGAGVDVGTGSGAGLSTGQSSLSTGGGKGLGRRSGRGVGSGSGTGTVIGIPLGTGSGGGEQGVDINELIKWMKAHPGTIPRLVQHDMNHKAGDLSSAVTFTMSGRKFELFLSCNEADLLLRICLIEGGKFTMLKDNGLKETSNFLAIGDVVRQNAEIQSLITSRQPPGEMATRFYSIFWSWWEKERAK